MKITQKIVEDVVSEVAGADTIDVISALKNKKNVSEFKIAEDIKKEINETRNMLYRLYHSNLVSFIRRKDKKKGWYIYYWTFDIKRVKYLVFEIKKKKIINLKERLERETNTTFFVCPEKCIRLSFDQAFDFEYKCPECGNILQQENNVDKIRSIEKEMKQLEIELKKQ